MHGKTRSITLITVLFLLVLHMPVPCAEGAVPDPPQGLAAISGNAEVSLTWGSVSGATGYLLYRGTANGGPYGFVAETQGSGYSDRNLINYETYYYVVTALNADGESAYSAPVDATPTEDVLVAPTHLRATPGNGEASLAWHPVTSAVSYNVYRATSRGGPYTVLSPAAPGPSYTDRGLTNGAAYYYVVQTMSTHTGAYSDEVSATPSGLLPVAPTGLAVAPGSTWTSLAWNASAGATAYLLYRSTTVGGAYTFLSQPISTTYEDTGLDNGTHYYYVVAAVNATNRGAFSPEADALVTLTERPHAAVLSASAGDGGVSLSWSNAPGAVSYKVYRSTTAGGPYDTDLGVQSSTYYDESVTNGTAYYYVVDAHNAGTDTSEISARSNEASATPGVQLAPPSGITVQAGNTQVTVTWNPVAGADQYYVTRVTASGDPISGGGGTGLRPHFTATGLTNGETYYYKIQSGHYAWSAYSGAVSIAPSSTLPLAPANLQVHRGNTELSLTWDAVTGATSYEVYRREKGEAWPSTPVGSSTATLFNDTALENGTTYYYVAAAVNASGRGAVPTNEVDGTPTAVALPAPGNIVVAPGDTQATVTWDTVPGADQYYVTLAQSPGGQAVSGGGGAGLRPSFTAKNLTNSIPYYFRIQTGSSIWSAFSAEVTTAPLVALPLAPTNLQVHPGNTELSLTWDAVTGATSYQIYRRKGGEAWPATPLGSPTATLFNDSGLENGTKYYYIVAAVNTNGQSAVSEHEAYGTPGAVALPAPLNVVATPGDTQATVTWDPVAGANQYYLTVAESPGGPAITGGGSSGLRPSFTATGLTNDRTYYFRIQTGSSIWSAFSAEASSVPLVALPLAPTNLQVHPGNTQLSLTWSAVDGATQYDVYRRTDGSKWPETPIATVTATLFTDSGLTNDTRYHYCVAAGNASGTGAWSAESSDLPRGDAVTAPTNVVAVAGNTQATVSWDSVVDATSYYVTVSLSPGGEAITGGGSTGNTFFVVAGLENESPYYFRVQAASPSVWSAFSDEVSSVPNPAANNTNITGRVSATVAGYGDLGVRNASVSLEGTSYSTTPDENGNFALLDVPMDDYNLVITAPNMVSITQSVSLTEQNVQLSIPPMSIAEAGGPGGDANTDGQIGLADAIYILEVMTGVRTEGP